MQGADLRPRRSSSPSAASSPRSGGMGVENNNDAILERERPGHGHHGPPLPLGRHRLDERHPELAAGRDHGLLPDLLRAQQRRPDPRRRLRPGQGPRAHPKYYGADPQGHRRRRPCPRSSRPRWGPSASSSARRPRRRPSRWSGTPRPPATPTSCPWPSWRSALLDGESSRLYRRLVREEQLAIDVGGGIAETIDPHALHHRRPAPAGRRPRPHRGRHRGGAGQGQGRTASPRPEFQKALNIDPQRLLLRACRSITGKAGQLGPGRDPLRRLREALHRHGRLRGRQDRTGSRRPPAKYFTENNKTVGTLIPEGGAK